MAESSFPIQALQRRRRALGQKLEPFSIGHAFILGALSNPFSPFGWDPEAQKLDKLVEAIFVLSNSFEDFHRLSRSIFHQWRMRQWGRFSGKFDPHLEREIVRIHVLEASTAPKVWTTNGRELGAPTLLLVYQHMRWERGLSESETMNHPFGKAVWDYLGEYEQRNRIQICNALELQMEAMVLAHKAETEKQKAAAPAEGRPQWPAESQEPDYAI